MSLLLHYTSCHVGKQAIEHTQNLYGKATLQTYFEVQNMTLASTLDYARLLRIFNIAVLNASYVLVGAMLKQLEFDVLVHMQV